MFDNLLGQFSPRPKTVFQKVSLDHPRRPRPAEQPNPARPLNYFRTPLPLSAYDSEALFEYIQELVERIICLFDPYVVENRPQKVLKYDPQFLEAARLERGRDILLRKIVPKEGRQLGLSPGAAVPVPMREEKLSLSPANFERSLAQNPREHVSESTERQDFHLDALDLLLTLVQLEEVLAKLGRHRALLSPSPGQVL